MGRHGEAWEGMGRQLGSQPPFLLPLLLLPLLVAGKCAVQKGLHFLAVLPCLQTRSPLLLAVVALVRAGVPRCTHHQAAATCPLADETLVHSSFKPVPQPDYIIPVEIEVRLLP